MDDTRKKKISNKFFPCYHFLTPAFNATEALYISFLMNRGILQETKRKKQIEDGCKYQDLDKLRPHPIDQSWIHCEYKHVKKVFPFMAKQTYSSLLKKLKHVFDHPKTSSDRIASCINEYTGLIETRRIALHNDDDLDNKRTHIRLNPYHIEAEAKIRKAQSNQIHEWIEGAKPKYLTVYGDYRNEKRKEYTDHYCNVYTNTKIKFDSSNEMLFYFWLKNWSKIKHQKRPNWVPVSKVAERLGMHKDTQLKIVKSLVKKGAIQVELEQEGQKTYRKIRLKPTEYEKPATVSTKNRLPRKNIESVVPTNVGTTVGLPGKPTKMECSSVLFGEAKQSKIATRHLEWAKRLYKTVKSSKLTYGHHSMKSWAKEFSKLERAIRSENMTQTQIEEHISKTLDWYCLNINRPMMPECFCGSSFRKKFVKIEKAMQRGFVDTTRPVSSEAATIAKEIVRDSRKEWHETAQKQLPHIVQQNLDRLSEWKVKVKNFLTLHKKKIDEYGRVSDELVKYVREIGRTYLTVDRTIKWPLIELHWKKSLDTNDRGDLLDPEYVKKCGYFGESENMWNRAAFDLFEK